MAWTIIVASSQGDQLDALTEGAEQIAEAISGAATVVRATSVEEVRKRRNTAMRRDQLLIVEAGLPSREASTDPDILPGLELIKSVAREPKVPACILVSPDLNIKHFRIVQALERCELLSVDSSTDYVRDCLQLAKRLKIIASAQPDGPSQEPDTASGAPPMVPSPSVANGSSPDDPLTADPAPAQSNDSPNYAVLEVHLRSKWQSGLVTFGNEFEALNLNQCEVEELIKESKKLADLLNKARDSGEGWESYSQQWSADYQRLGERVGNLLWRTPFADFYRLGYGSANGNVRVRFNLDQPYFDAAWEAIYDKLDTGSKSRFLMLDRTVTVARRVNQLNIRNLFSANRSDSNSTRIEVEDGVLNVLVLQADVPHNSIPEGPSDPLWEIYWNSLDGRTLPSLPHLQQEVDMLRELARTRKGGVKINVEVLTARPGKPLADEVEHYLKDRSRRYNVVHFAGHALFAPSSVPQDGRGYLVFSGEPGERPRPVPIATFADWLEGSDVQLVYLSCCRSSAAAAALELAARDVPLTIGFNWDLDDVKAVDFAENFYTELLNARLKVCPAFTKARRNLYDHFAAGDPIWAAPVLIVQPKDWVYVEGGLRLGPAPRPKPKGGHSSRGPKRTPPAPVPTGAGSAAPPS